MGGANDARRKDPAPADRAPEELVIVAGDEAAARAASITAEAANWARTQQHARRRTS